MRLKVHLTGFACAYEAGNFARPKSDRPPLPGRDQGSLYNQQKHALADAIEWIRRNSKYKPRIMVATTPGYLDDAKEGKLISKLVDNMKHNYGLGEYVWVRELTKKGFPHYHFIADLPQIDAVKLSQYWSSLFPGAKHTKYSIRMGSRPDANGKRKFWITNQKMAWYLSKYIGKELRAVDEETGELVRKKYRTFAISPLARKESQPLVYHSYISELYNGTKQRIFELSPDLIEPGLPMHVDPQGFNWKWTGHGQTYVGFARKKATA